MLQFEKTAQELYNVLQSVNGAVTLETMKAALDEKLKGKKQLAVQRIRLTEFIETEIISDSA